MNICKRSFSNEHAYEQMDDNKLKCVHCGFIIEQKQAEDRYLQVDKNGDKVIRYNTKKEYTKEGLKKQRDQFVIDAKAGKILCLSDLMINHKM